MKVETELAGGQVRLSFVFDGTSHDTEFAERVCMGLGALDIKMLRYRTADGRVIDAKDDVRNIARAFESALLACRALEEVKALHSP